MATLYFSDLLKRADIDPKRVKLLRHAYSDEKFKACADEDMLYEYTCHQKPDFSKGYDYWCVFVSGKSTLARFVTMYKVGKSVPDTPERIPDGLPEIEAKKYNGESSIYELEYVDLLKEYENKLVIEWGAGTRQFAHRGTTEKPIVSIRAEEKKTFKGYDKVRLSYEQLKEIIEDVDEIYADWHTALKSVNAIYLIVDTESGKQYVGSAYGSEGLFGRWSCYVQSHHGGNKLMKEEICYHPDRYHAFQFSILQILPKTMSPEEIINTETLWKLKLQSIKFGLNDN